MGKTMRKWWMNKPFRNTMGVVPKPHLSSRTVRTDLVPRVEQLVAGGAIPKPVWLDAVLAHPPPLAHRFSGERPVRFEWREEDRLRRIWQRRNPEASMHPKVLFLDESRLPASAIEHPADAFVKKQQALMRRGLSEEEAYRRVAGEQEERRRVADAEVAAAREQARALGASPAGGGGGAPAPDGDGLAARLLRRFAEEARDSGQPYPRHWYHDDGSWRGIGLDDNVDQRTKRAIERQGELMHLMRQRDASFEEAATRDETDDNGVPVAGRSGAGAAPKVD